MLVMTRGAFILLLLIGLLFAFGVWSWRRRYPLVATAAWVMATTFLALLVLGASGVIGA